MYVGNVRSVTGNDWPAHDVSSEPATDIGVNNDGLFCICFRLNITKHRMTPRKKKRKKVDSCPTVLKSFWPKKKRKTIKNGWKKKRKKRIYCR